MKKIFLLLFMLLFVLTLVSCGDKKTQEIEKIKELVPVDSVMVKDENEEEFLITKNTPFYDALNCFDLTYKENKMIEFDSKIKLGDNEKAVATVIAYYANNNDYLFDYELKDGIRTFTAQEYFKTVYQDNLNWSRKTFSKYTYGFQKAFCGQEIICENANNTLITYSNINYPLTPNPGTDFSNAEAQARKLTQMLIFFSFFIKYDDFVFDGEKIVVEDYVTRSFELYEDTIVFTQTAPFVTDRIMGPNSTKYAFYKNCISGGCEITQTVMFDLKTRQIEYVEVKGNTFSSAIQTNFPLEVDVIAKVSKLDVNKYEEVVNTLVDYVMKNSK